MNFHRFLESSARHSFVRCQLFIASWAIFPDEMTCSVPAKYMSHDHFWWILFPYHLWYFNDELHDHLLLSLWKVHFCNSFSTASLSGAMIFLFLTFCERTSRKSSCENSSPYFNWQSSKLNFSSRSRWWLVKRFDIVNTSKNSTSKNLRKKFLTQFF